MPPKDHLLRNSATLYYISTNRKLYRISFLLHRASVFMYILGNSTVYKYSIIEEKKITKFGQREKMFLLSYGFETIKVI